MSRAEEAAIKAYPKASLLSEPHGVIPADNRTHYLGDANEENRQACCKGYEQAEKDTIERACEWMEKNIRLPHPRKGTEECIVNLNAFREAMEEKK